MNKITKLKIFLIVMSVFGYYLPYKGIIDKITFFVIIVSIILLADILVYIKYRKMKLNEILNDVLFISLAYINLIL